MFFGLSVKGALTRDMVASMADKPIIFALANPDPEITPEEARAVSPMRSSRPGEAITRTRSITFWASPISSAARWMSGRDHQ